MTVQSGLASNASTFSFSSRVWAENLGNSQVSAATTQRISVWVILMRKKNLLLPFSVRLPFVLRRDILGETTENK